jgi:hypothetical protein
MKKDRRSAMAALGSKFFCKLFFRNAFFAKIYALGGARGGLKVFATIFILMNGNLWV